MERTSCMQRTSCRGHLMARSGLLLAVIAVAVSGGAGGGGADAGSDYEYLMQPVRLASARVVAWYHRTPPADRVTWGGLAACAGLGLGVLLERLARLRMRGIVPRDFASRFLGR